jgi:hypothetical protein
MAEVSPWHRWDRIFKALCHTFPEDILQWLNITGQLVGVSSPELRGNARSPDILFELRDDQGETRRLTLECDLRPREVDLRAAMTHSLFSEDGRAPEQIVLNLTGGESHGREFSRSETTIITQSIFWASRRAPGRIEEVPLGALPFAVLMLGTSHEQVRIALDRAFAAVTQHGHAHCELLADAIADFAELKFGEEEAMTIQETVRKRKSFSEILQEERNDALKTGIESGIETGIERERRSILGSQLRARFGERAQPFIDQLDTQSGEVLRSIATRFAIVREDEALLEELRQILSS